MNQAVTTDRAPTRPFTISRMFDASRDQVWRAWSELERLKQWWGPKGFTVEQANLDFRPGGRFHYCLRAPDGSPMWGRKIYREIVAFERIVWVNSFSDEAGGLTHHPMMPTWPLEMLSTATFTENGGKTTVAITWTPIDPSDIERATFDAGHASMMMGWGGTFEQLAEYLRGSR